MLVGALPITVISCYACYVWGYHVGTREIFELKKELKIKEQ